MKKFSEWLKSKKVYNEFMGDFFQNSNPPSNPPSNTPLIPKTGDKAYSTKYGISREGTLKITNTDIDGRPRGELITHGQQPWFSDPKQNLTVGYDHPIVWDKKRGMWYAEADAD